MPSWSYHDDPLADGDLGLMNSSWNSSADRVSILSTVGNVVSFQSACRSASIDSLALDGPPAGETSAATSRRCGVNRYSCLGSSKWICSLSRCDAQGR